MVAISATLHCLTGCAIGEVSGMAIGTALGFSNFATIVLAIALAFLFGYTLTSLPLLRAGLSLGAVVPIALASDTFSIATMEIVDNLIMVAIPGAMHAGLDEALFWGALSVALVIAGVFAVPVNRWLIARGKGHVAVHETGIHGGPSPRVVGVVAAIAFVFGSVVLIAEAADGEDGGHGGGHRTAAERPEGGHGGAGADVPGLATSANGTALALERTELPRGERAELRFRVLGDDGRAVRDFELEHDRRLHLIVVRRDMAGFQHLHPRIDARGVWSTPITLPDAGSYRVFADFKRDGEKTTLGADLAVDGAVDWRALPPPASTTTTAGGYRVTLAADRARAGRELPLRFEVERGGRAVPLEDYLGAKGHLVALREGDLGYLHTHPTSVAGHRGGEHGGHGGAAGEVGFATTFPSAGRYRLFLQFKHAGRVRTAGLTRVVAR